MSEIKVNSIKGVGASDAAITVNNTDGTCTANLSNRQNRNLIINGAMQVAQRATSSTTSGYGDLDRWKHEYSGHDEAPTFARVSLTSSDTPYTLGLTKATKITNGNQTGGFQNNRLLNFNQQIEAQNIRNSGWNYTSSSSYITLSYWVRASVAQEYFGFVKTVDGTNYVYPFSLGSLSANTWTKITKTIPGNSNLVINDDNESGFQVFPIFFGGSDYTASSVTNDAWATWSSASRSKDQTATWWETNDSTFEITGVQLEVGSVATDFEHRSFGQELALCQRYYYMFAPYVGYNGRSSYAGISEGATFYTATNIFAQIEFPTTMRTTPSIDYPTGTNYYIIYRQGTNMQFDGSGVTMEAVSDENKACINKNGTPSSASAGDAAIWRLNANNAYMAANAEL